MAIELDFAIAGQALSRTDSDAVAAGAVGMKAKFTFDSAWDGLGTIIARFTGPTHEHFDATVTAGACTVPWEALAYPMMIVSVAGYTGGIEKVTTQDLVIPVLTSQSSLQVPAPPTPTEYAEITQSLDAATAAVKEVGVQAHASATAAATSATASATSAAAAASSLSQLETDIGTTVCSLGTDGKIPTANIPALATTETYVVANAASLLTLRAQRGDFGLILKNGVITDSYILVGDDPTASAGWIKFGVGYVAQAGHAMQADSAADSDKVDGNHLLAMTQAQYDAAAIYANTIYLVG